MSRQIFLVEITFFWKTRPPDLAVPSPRRGFDMPYSGSFRQGLSDGRPRWGDCPTSRPEKKAAGWIKPSHTPHIKPSWRLAWGPPAVHFDRNFMDT